MNIEKLLPEHVKEILKIEKEAFPKTPWPEKGFLDCLALSHILPCILKKDNEIVSYIVVSLSKPEASILNLAVKKSIRRAGHGSFILKYILNSLRDSGYRDVFLEVRKGNIPAWNLYKKFGFAPIGERKKYYADGEDAIVMKLKLL